ncbi:I78 family peptidase inhibitor [Lysobacter humi (ex Lee et al. 2017)]
MALHANPNDAAFPRLLVPVVVLIASVAACSVMPPADAGTPSACQPGNADRWVGRAASAEIVEQARQASGSETVHLRMPGDATDTRVRSDRLSLELDERSIIARATCG